MSPPSWKNHASRHFKVDGAWVTSSEKLYGYSHKARKLWASAGCSSLVEITAKSSRISFYKEGFRGFSALCKVFTQMGFLQGGGQFKQITPVPVEWKVTVTVHTCVPVPGIRSFSDLPEVRLRSVQESAMTKADPSWFQKTCWNNLKRWWAMIEWKRKSGKVKHDEKSLSEPRRCQHVSLFLKMLLWQVAVSNQAAVLNGQGSSAADLEGPEKLRRGHKSDCQLFIYNPWTNWTFWNYYFCFHLSTL